MGRKRFGAKPKKEKQPKYEMVDPKDEKEGKPLYALLSDLLAAHHEEIVDLRILLAWRIGAKPGRDGLVSLGKCNILNERNREAFSADVVIELNVDEWRKASEGKRTAILDHELTHIGRSEDKNGDLKKDARGRLCLRVRKHDLTEFLSIFERYGPVTNVEESFVRHARQLKLFSETPSKAEGDEKPSEKKKAS